MRLEREWLGLIEENFTRNRLWYKFKIDCHYHWKYNFELDTLMYSTKEEDHWFEFTNYGKLLGKNSNWKNKNDISRCLKQHLRKSKLQRIKNNI